MHIILYTRREFCHAVSMPHDGINQNGIIRAKWQLKSQESREKYEDVLFARSRAHLFFATDEFKADLRERKRERNEY